MVMNKVPINCILIQPPRLNSSCKLMAKHNKKINVIITIYHHKLKNYLILTGVYNKLNTWRGFQKELQFLNGPNSSF